MDSERYTKRNNQWPYSRPRAQFFPIQTDVGRQITCLFFSSVEYFVSSFCVEFSLQPFSNLVYACIWYLGNRKSMLRFFAFLCFLGHYLHFTFFAVKAGKDVKARKLVAVRTWGPRWENPDQIQEFRIPDRSDAWENNKLHHHFRRGFIETLCKTSFTYFNLSLNI